MPTKPVLHFRIYERSPESPWVVLVHGAGGSSAIWYRQVRVFQREFNVLLVDLRGHGGSGTSDAIGSPRYTFEDVSRDVIDVLDHLNIDRAHFVGMSLGSIVIRIIAELAPDRVETLVMGGAIMRLDVRSRVLVGLGNLFKRVVPFIWLYRLFAWIIMPRKAHRKARSLFVREAQNLCRTEFLRWFRLTAEINPLLRLFRERELPHPTLYLMGEEDHLFLPAVRATVARHGRSVLEVIRGSGHVCNVEQPDVFNHLAMGGAIMRLDVRSRVLVGLGNLFKRVVPFIWLYRLFAWIIMPRKAHRKARSLFVREAQNLCRTEFLRWFRLTAEINPLLRLFRERELPHPTLYLMGEEDHLFLPAVRATVARHGRSVLEVIRGSGHVCNVEQPDVFNHLAMAFMRQPDLALVPAR